MSSLPGLSTTVTFNVVELGHLQGERTNAPACPIQEQLLAGIEGGDRGSDELGQATGRPTSWN